MKIVLPLALASIAAGCATFSDSNAVARVNDTELNQDDFEDRLTALGVTDQDVLALDPVRAEITAWIQSELVDPQLIADLYDSGGAVSGVVCLSAIVVDDQTTADTIADELANGADFATTFNAANVDPSIAESQGAVPCITTVDLEASASVPIVEAARDLSASTPIATAPLLDDTGQEIASVVIAFRPYDELSLSDTDVVSASVDVSSQLADADIYVDPRYGTFDAETGQVVALGGTTLNSQ